MVANNKIIWKIVPAERQHQNGSSENLIKSLKTMIQHFFGQTRTFSELQLAFKTKQNISNLVEDLWKG